MRLATLPYAKPQDQTMNDNWKLSYKGYGIVAGTDLHDGTAKFTITQPGADGQPEMVYEGGCEVGYSDDDDAWDAAMLRLAPTSTPSYQRSLETWERSPKRGNSLPAAPSSARSPLTHPICRPRAE